MVAFAGRPTSTVPHPRIQPRVMSNAAFTRFSPRPRCGNPCHRKSVAHVSACSFGSAEFSALKNPAARETTPIRVASGSPPVQTAPQNVGFNRGEHRSPKSATVSRFREHLVPLSRNNIPWAFWRKTFVSGGEILAANTIRWHVRC